MTHENNTPSEVFHDQTSLEVPHLLTEDTSSAETGNVEEGMKRLHEYAGEQATAVVARLEALHENGVIHKVPRVDVVARGILQGAHRRKKAGRIIARP